MSDSADTSAPIDDGAATSSAPASAHVADPWGLLLAGLLAVRLVMTGHAPNLFDAAIAGGLALLLFALSLGCAVSGVVLTTRTDHADRAGAYRIVAIGMTAFVAYYLVHPYLA